MKYEEKEAHRSAIKQDFRDNEKKIKMRLRILNFISAKFVMGYPCARLYILFHIHMVQLFCIFLGYVNITKLLKFKTAAERP